MASKQGAGRQGAGRQGSGKQGREAREMRDRLRVYQARQDVHATGRRRRIRDNVIAVVGVVAVAALAGVAQFSYFNFGPGAPTPTPSATSLIPDPSVAEDRTWTGELTLNDTALGVELDGAAAPQAVASIVTDVQDGYYVDKTCHRLVTSATAVLIQCGSSDGTGASDADYAYGPIENAPADAIYPEGTIAMARQGDNAESNGHQFFITFTDTQLPNDTAGGYTVVGKVTSGLDDFFEAVVSKGTETGESDGTPLIPVTIKDFTLK